MVKLKGYRKFELSDLFILLEILVVCIAIAIPVALATVTDKGTKRYGKGDKYLVYCHNENGDSEVFEITDSILKFRFDSSDLYNDVQIGETYEFTICGSRVPWLSWYPNIYQIKEAERSASFYVNISAISPYQNQSHVNKSNGISIIIKINHTICK